MAAKTRTNPKTPRSGRGAHPAAHPREVPILAADLDEERDPDQPFEEGVRDSLDPDLRHRMISETAFRLYEERGCVDGYELDDWLQAEAEVDHLVLNRSRSRAPER